MVRKASRVIISVFSLSLLMPFFQNCGPSFSSNNFDSLGLTSSSGQTTAQAPLQPDTTETQTPQSQPSNQTPTEPGMATDTPQTQPTDTETTQTSPTNPPVPEPSENKPDTAQATEPEYQKITITQALASSHDGNLPANTFDNQLTTRWSAEGRGEFIILDTQKNIQISSLKIAFYMGTSRKTQFRVEVSSDGKSFTSVSSNLSSSGSSLEKESFNVKADDVQFVKIIGLGNSLNQWNSLTEIDIIGKDTTPSDFEPVVLALETPTSPDFQFCDLNLPSFTVSNFTELNSALNQTKSSGGVIRLKPGNYGQRLSLIGRKHSAKAPLVLIGEGENTDIKFDGASTGYALKIENSSYIYVENISLFRGWDSVIVNNSDHIVMKKLDLSQPKQAGFHVGKNSKFIDIIDNKVYDTGKTNSHYGECIYIGTGSLQNFPDQTENVWISDNDISNCGHGEAINIKTEVFNTTVKNNNIYNIKPGSPTHSQYNQAAITVEGGRGSTLEQNHRPNDPRMVWVEGNKIRNVTYGKWANAIMVAGTGVIVQNNDISEFQESGIFINQYNNLGSPVYLGNNQVVNTNGKNAIKIGSGVNVIKDKIPVNPNKPQNWFCN